MKILKNQIPKQSLLESEIVLEGPMIKAVVDVSKEIIAIDAEMHFDLEQFLLNSGSLQNDLWGINFWPKDNDEDFIEYDSLINIRPNQGNLSRDIEDDKIKNIVAGIVNKWII